MSDQQANESAASGAEAKAQAAAESKNSSGAESVSAGRTDAEETIRSFPLAIYQPSTQYRRFAVLAASLAVAAALGGLIGSLSTYGPAGAKTDPVDPTRNLQAALTQVNKDVAALKVSVDTANRAAAGQMAKITERFDRSERAQAEPAAKIAALTDTVTRLEKRITANAEASRDVTGSLPERAAAAAATVAAKDQSKPVSVECWVLRDIYRGRALVESRSGLYEVA